MKTANKAEMPLWKWLSVIDSVYVIYWISDNKDEPLWAGYCEDTPFWIAQNYKIKNYTDEFLAPIDFRNDLGEKYRHRAGFVISLVDREDENE